MERGPCARPEFSAQLETSEPRQPRCPCCAGTKWTVTKLDPVHATAPIVSRFIHRTSRLLGTPIDRLEPPTVRSAAWPARQGLRMVCPANPAAGSRGRLSSHCAWAPVQRSRSRELVPPSQCAGHALRAGPVPAPPL